MLLLRKPQLRATRVFERTLSTRAVFTGRPKPISREVCRKAQMAHQERKMRRNLYCERGDLAICFGDCVLFWRLFRGLAFTGVLAFCAWYWRGYGRRGGGP